MLDITKTSLSVKLLAVFIAFYWGLGVGAGVSVLETDFGFNLSSLNLAQVVTSTTSTSSVPAATIKVTSPSGGEVFAIGQTVKISWQATGFDQVRLTIWQNTAYRGDIATVQNTGSYDWLVPDRLATGTGYRIRVRDPNTGPATTFADSNTFTLATKPVVPIIPPITKPVATTTPLLTSGQVSVPAGLPNLVLGGAAIAKVSPRGAEYYSPIPNTNPTTFHTNYTIDGNTNLTNLWCSDNSTQSEDWVRVELPNTKTISQVIVYQAAGPYTCTKASDYKIQTSLDGVTWVTVASVTSNTDTDISHIFTATQARYVRFYSTKLPNVSAARLGIRDIQVYGPQSVFINSVSPNQVTYGSTQTLTINGGGFTATGTRIMLNNVQIQAPFSSTNNGTKITFQAPLWAWPKTYRLELFNTNGLSNPVNLIINPPAGGYILAKSSTGKTAYATLAAVDTSKLTLFAKFKDFVSSSVAAVTSVLKSTPTSPTLTSAGNLNLTIDDGESVSFTWDFPDDTYTACYRAGGTTLVPSFVDSQSVIMGDKNFKSATTSFGSATLFHSPPDPQGESHPYWGPWTSESLKDYNQGSYTTSPLKRPQGVDTTQPASIGFGIACAKATSSDPTKALAIHLYSGQPGPFNPGYWSVSSVGYGVNVTIKPTPYYQCENSFPAIQSELKYGGPARITEADFASWASNETFRVPITDPLYDASGGGDDILDEMIYNQFCYSIGTELGSPPRELPEVGNNALNNIILLTERGEAVGFNIGWFESGVPKAHRLIALDVVKQGSILPSYEVLFLDSNGPGVSAMECSFDLAWLATICLYDGREALPISILGSSGLPATSAYCGDDATSGTEYCQRKPAEWLKNSQNYPSIPNFAGDPLAPGGLCHGWSEFVLRVAGGGIFGIIENSNLVERDCPAPRI